MKERVLGLIVAGGGCAPLAGLGVADDAALTPFAGKYRFIDFALATLANSGVTSTYVVAERPASALRAHLARRERRRSFLAGRPGMLGAARGRAARLLRALAGCRDLLRARDVQAIVVLLADHILQVDLRPLCDYHRDLAADVTLAALPLSVGEPGGPSPRLPAALPCLGLAYTWTGDVVLRPAALPALLAAASPEEVSDDTAFVAPLAAGLRVAAYDVLEGPLPGRHPGRPAYWHEPATLEAYYDAQMQLCTPRPDLDLHDPAWPLTPAASGLGPAKVVSDAAGRAGQALNALLADGALVRGGVVLNTVVGYGVVVESGAVVEDSVLLDGCRIGWGARVRRAVVGAGAVVGDGEEIGYDALPPPGATVLASGLTIVPAVLPGALAAAVGH